MKTLIFKILLSVLVLANVSTFGERAHGAVWETHGRKWSDLAIMNPDKKTYVEGYTWDDVCSDWIREKLDIEIFNTTRTPFQEVPDCGKVAALIHLQCAIEFHLPYALHGKKEFSNNMTRYDSIADPKARIWAYMQFVNKNSSADNIPEDTYAVDINRSNVRPGTIALFLKGAPLNHTLTVKEVSPDGDLTFINGTHETEEAKQKILTRQLFMTYGIESDAAPFKPNRDGLRNWRHYDEQLGAYIPLKIDKDGNPSEKGYNPNKQFSQEFKFYADKNDQTPRLHTWQQAAQHAIQEDEGNIGDRLDELQKAACGLMTNRARVVLDGEDVLQDLKKSHKANSLDPIKYDGYFTRQRDSNITDRLRELESLLAALPDGYNQKPYFLKDRKDSFSSCEVSYGHNLEQIINLAQFEEALFNGVVSSDANASLEQKWGLAPTQSPLAQNGN